MATLVTAWYAIDVDGHPDKAGWYECMYEDDEQSTMLYWDGACWRYNPVSGQTAFGNYDTLGERWRGALTPHGGLYV